MIVDSHCHLNYAGLVERQDTVVADARARGVETMLNISTRVSEWADVIGAAERHAGVWASVGVHPHEADHHVDVSATALLQQTDHPRVVAIGETGLDYYYDKSDRAQQRLSFDLHLRVAHETGLPIIVHTRDAETDTLDQIGAAMRDAPVTGVIHCFTASDDFARRAIDLGFYISLSGIVTFKNAKALQDTARWLPVERLLVETDAPFLAPVPHRGKTAEPAHVVDTARFLADLRGEDFEDLCASTTSNFYDLFSKVARPVVSGSAL